jgi:hypothetical protein
MGTTLLRLYNNALLILGERKLATTADNVESRRALDDAYADGLDYCLGQGYWNFAMRSVAIDASLTTIPTFGYTAAFEKPEDWIRTYLVANNDIFNPPLIRYSDEGEFWYADVETLYVQFISNDEDWGGDLAKWSPFFSEYAATHLARKTCKRITGSSDGVKDLFALERLARIDARAKDAMNEPPKFPPRGTWTTSRTTMADRQLNRDGSDSGQ